MSQNPDAPHLNNVLIFSAAVSNSFKQIAESLSESTFVEAFTILDKKRNTARALHKVLIEDLYNCMDADFKDMLAEGTLVDALTKANKLAEEAALRTNEKVWRPPGNVKQHLISLDAEKIQEENERLEKQLSELDNVNDALMEKISEERRRVQAMNERMRRILDKSSVAISYVQNTIEHVRDCVEDLEKR